MINNTNSVLVRLHVSFWSGYRHDKVASKEAVEKHKMEKGSINSNKKLVSKMHLKAMKDVVTKFKTYFNDNTLPYNDLLATRILPTSQAIEFRKEVDIAQGLLNKTVSDFMDSYDEILEDARERLGTLFNMHDYPNKEDLPRKFAITVIMMPVPNPDQFNKAISNKEVQRLQQRLEDMSIMAKMDLIYRVEKVAATLLDTLEKPGKRIYKTTVQHNIDKVSHQLEELNYENDPLLQETKEFFDERLLGMRIEDVRDSPRYRKKMIGKVNEVLDFVNEIIKEAE